jgi:radical SAM protein with 4Fe4S-binding SPASM domain
LVQTIINQGNQSREWEMKIRQCPRCGQRNVKVNPTSGRAYCCGYFFNTRDEKFKQLAKAEKEAAKKKETPSVKDFAHKGMCAECEKRGFCTALCPEAEAYVNQDYVGLDDERTTTDLGLPVDVRDTRFNTLPPVKKKEGKWTTHTTIPLDEMMEANRGVRDHREVDRMLDEVLPHPDVAKRSQILMRKVVTLRNAGYKFSKISFLLDISEAYARKLYERGMKLLKKRFGNCHESPYVSKGARI